MVARTSRTSSSIAVGSPITTRRIAGRTFAPLQGVRGIIFEVESVEGAEGAERDLRRRRIDFYQRNGAAIVDCAPLYRAPATNSGATLPFTLMWLPVRGAPPRVAGDLLRGCVEAILAQSYGLDPSSPIVRQVLGDLAC